MRETLAQTDLETASQNAFTADLTKLPGYNQDWENRLETNPHLRVYLEKIVVETGTLPTLVSSLSRGMGTIKLPNILYPVGDPVFIHIYSTGEDKPTMYIPVEPRLTEDRDLILNEVEKRMAFLINHKQNYVTIEEKKNYLYKLLDQKIKL